MAITLGYLEDNLQHLEQIARWCCNEWPSYYDNGSLEASRIYYRNTISKNHIPCTMMASYEHDLAGTISLIVDDMEVRPQYTPWLGSLYVSPAFRGGGVARHLIRFCTEHARRLGVTELYAWSKILKPLFLAEGWSHVERVHFLGDDVDVLKIALRRVS